MTWRELWARAESALGSRMEARRIVERASGYEGAGLVAHLDEAAPARAVPFADAMVERRSAGEPLQYVVGRWAFRTLELLVDPRVLIPRPETEVVVEAALGELERLPSRAPVVVDLGVGSGAIALSIAHEAPRARVWGTDVSPAALAVTRANLAGLGSADAPRVQLAEGRWFDAVPPDLHGQVDLVVSNPPYVAETEAADLPAEVGDWEPRQALVAGPTGLEAITEIVAEAPGWLARPGAVVVEIAPHQAKAASRAARAAGFEQVDVRPDLQGRLRVLVGRL